MIDKPDRQFVPHIDSQIDKMLIVLLVLALCASLTACKKETVTETTEAAVVSAETVKPLTEQAQAPSRYSAVVKPRVQVDVSFKTVGYIDSLAKARGEDGRLRVLEPGDSVRKGQRLASLRARESQIRIQAQQAALDENKSSQQNAQAVADEANANLLQAQQDFSRAERLFQSDSMTQPDYDAAKARVSIAQAKVEQAKAQVTANRAAEGRVSAGIAEAQLALADCYLNSPISGVVVDRKVEEGSLVSQGTVAFTLADDRSVKVSFGVPDLELKNLRPGEEVEVFSEADPHAKFTGRISEIGPAADPQSRTFNVEVTVPNGDHRLKLGMVVALSVGSSSVARNLLTIPLSAVVRSTTDPSQYAVFTIDDQQGKTKAVERNVKLGETLGGQIAVNQGLKDGDRVVTTGSTRIVNGQEIRIAD